MREKPKALKPEASPACKNFSPESIFSKPALRKSSSTKRNLERVLLPLGEKHIGYGATPEAFPKVGGADLQGTDIGVADLDSPFLVGALMPDGAVGE